MEKQKYLIYYNTGALEVSDSINITLIHMVEQGVIKFIYCMNDNEAYVRNQEGTTDKVKVHTISGL